MSVQRFSVGQRVAVDMPNGRDTRGGLPNIHGSYGHVTATRLREAGGDKIFEYTVDIHPTLPRNRFGNARVVLFGDELQAID